MMTDDWHGLYGEGWQGEIVPEAFAHPAKFSRGLIRHIYRHLLEEDLVQPGDVIADPFGGVALGALDAQAAGLSWVGCELEPRFVALGRQNLALWQSRYSAMPRWSGRAALLQGDSRNLAAVLQGQVEAVVSSPPFSPLGNQPTGRGQGVRSDYAAGKMTENEPDSTYGSTPGQLGALPAGDFAAVVSSPPFGDAIGSDDPAKRGGLFRDPKRAGDRNLTGEYGQEPGQLGGMSIGDFAAVVSSPPYEGNAKSDYLMSEDGKTRARDERRGFTQGRGCFRGSESAYGQTAGNLGIEQSDTFWSAARAIVAQCYQVLRPGGVAVWVTKRFVRGGKIVDFPDQWRQLCESCGFTTLHEHRAWLVEDRGTQFDLAGNRHHREIKRVSFFRRLAESKGSPRIDWETVLCMVKEVHP